MQALASVALRGYQRSGFPASGIGRNRNVRQFAVSAAVAQSIKRFRSDRVPRGLRCNAPDVLSRSGGTRSSAVLRTGKRHSQLQSPLLSGRYPAFGASTDIAVAGNAIRCSSTQSWSIGSHQHHHQQKQKQKQQQQRRQMSASAADPAKAAETKARAFVVTVGYSPSIAKGVVKALKDSGLSGEALFNVVKAMAGRWEVGEDEGLEELAASVKQELAREEGKATVTIHVVPPNAWPSGEEDDDTDNDDVANIPAAGSTDDATHTEIDMSKAFPVRGIEGMSITDVAKFGSDDGAVTLGEYIECACAGIMACSTCHVVVDDRWFPKVGKPSEAELDMIDYAYNPKPTSRLGCQIVLTKELDGMVVKLPKSSNNLMDFIPFE